ncbi:hypothetical protein IT408_01080 [Candidatus Uhrbacteria bacterium]|nr:hypothetical protein [Candidatus Uhrbacteria bacterium]
MTLSNTQDLFFLVLSIATGWIAVFFCWALYEIAKLLHQGNQVVTETREKVTKLEATILNVKDRLESSMSYLGMIADGGRAVMSYFKKDKNEDEDEEIEIVRKRRKK